MRTSCGALFYAFDLNCQLGIILGQESNEWLPFKGCNEFGETFEETAIREVYEESGGLVKISKINLEHCFTSKRKHYKIGLCEVPYNIIEQFAALRIDESRAEYKEKKKLKFFPLHTALNDPTIHNISKASIRYYWNRLIGIADGSFIPFEQNMRIRKLAINYLSISEQPIELISSESSDSDVETEKIKPKRRKYRTSFPYSNVARNTENQWRKTEVNTV